MGLLLKQYKYAVDITQRAINIYCKSVDTLLYTSSMLGIVSGSLYSNPT